MTEECETVHHRHLQVGQDSVGRLLLQQLEGARAVLRRSDRENAGAVQGAGQSGANEVVVFDEQ